MRKLFFLFALVCTLSGANAQINHWETAVKASDTWKYLVGTVEPDTNWRKLSFNDAAWLSGTGGVGFGDSDDGTTIAQNTSVYMRRTFNVVDTFVIAQALLNVDYDDGFIAYLNNVEIARSNMGTIAYDKPPYNALANGQHEAMMYQGGMPEGFIIIKSKIRECMVNGNNVIAVTVHNAAVNSPDLSSNTWLHFGITDASNNYQANPVWFVPPIESSNLPLVVVDTRGMTVFDSIKIVGMMGIIDNGAGNRNYLSDPFNDYEGSIAIEIRGSTSQQYPKKSYGFETQDSIGMNDNVSLLGMPKENDWILYGAYPDKTFMRNTLAFDLSRRMGHYGSRTRYCELILNGEYRGIYELFEKIKVDRGRIDIPKLDSLDNAGDSLTGGYVIKVDKTTGQGNPAWNSPYGNVYFQFHDPEDIELSNPQRNYIQTYVTDFENALNGPNYADPILGYRKYIDVQSFTDFMICQELGRTVDGYRSSSFLHKQRDSYGGKLFAGPMWDFNLSFGNADYCDAFNATNGWQYEFNNICPGYTPEIPFWWDRFMDDQEWKDELRCRWDFLRTDVLSTTRITSWIDSVATLLDESKDRNFDRWPILGVYVNWNYFVGNTYQEEIDYMKQWITDRLNWMDANLPPSPLTCGNIGASEIKISEINYNSVDTLDTGDWFELVNGGLVTVDISGWILKDSNPDNTYQVPNGTILAPGDRLVVCEDTAKFSAIHDTINNFIGPTGWAFDNNGEGIQLFDEDYMIARSMQFLDTPPWPTLPDGFGYTMENINQVGDHNVAANWTAGCLGGSPGRPYVTPCPGAAGVALEKPGEEIIVRPNPFLDVTEVIFPNSLVDREGDMQVIIMDVSGKIISSDDHFSGTIFRLEGSTLPRGMYFVSIRSMNGNHSVKKIVKM